MQDLYQILKISPTASMMEVEGAYNQLYSSLRHEVKYGGKQAKDQLFLVKRAYKILSDHESRCVYDLEWEFNSLKNPNSFQEERKMSREEISKSNWEKVWSKLKLANLGPETFSIWNVAVFQWFIVFISILTPVIIFMIVKMFITDFEIDEREKQSVPFLEKVGIKMDSPSNEPMTTRDFEAAWLLLKDHPLSDIKTDGMKLFKPISISNAAQCGLNEEDILDFFDDWSLSQIDSSMRQYMVRFYNERIEFNGEEMSKEELVFKKMAVYKTEPSFAYCISNTVIFEKLMNGNYSMKYINFAGGELYVIRAGYLEFAITESGPKIIKEQF